MRTPSPAPSVAWRTLFSPEPSSSARTLLILHALVLTSVPDPPSFHPRPPPGASHAAPSDQLRVARDLLLWAPTSRLTQFPSGLLPLPPQHALPAFVLSLFRIAFYGMSKEMLSARHLINKSRKGEGVRTQICSQRTHGEHRGRPLQTLTDVCSAVELSNFATDLAHTRASPSVAYFPGIMNIF